MCNIILYAECSAEMTSQCVTSGTVINIYCPVVDFIEYSDYVTWDLPFDYYNDEEISGYRKINMTAVWSGNQRGYDVNELTCSHILHHHAVLIITGRQKSY